MTSIVLSIFMSIGVLFLLNFSFKYKLSDTSILSILFVPTLLVWAEGRISEINAFGVSAKFNQIAEKKIEALVSGQDIDVYVTKAEALKRIDATQQSLSRGAFFEGCHDFIFVRSSQIPSTEDSLSRYAVAFAETVVSSTACGHFTGVVVVDEENRYIGSFDKEFFYQFGSLWTLADTTKTIESAEVWKRISNFTVAGASIKYPDIRLKNGEGFKAAISETATVEYALKEFKKSDASFMVVTDAYGKLQGVIRHRQFIDLLLLNIIQNNQ